MIKNKALTIFFITALALLSACSKDSGSSRPNFTPSNPNTGNTPVCVAIDTDQDGLRDCEDPDMDNDGVLNAEDAFPVNSAETVDTDKDGYGDNGDWAPADNTEWVDFDMDTVGDNADPDDDNDGAPDFLDAFRTRSLEMFDIDFDSLGNNEDPDDDNDGTPDSFDDIVWKTGSFDIDGDLIPSESDPDIDGDTTLNEADAFPYDNSESLDYDSDKIGNNKDPDDDNDAVPDVWDDFVLNRNYWADSDHDGFANEIDTFPYDANEWLDTDGDGFGNNGDAFPNNPLEWLDTDQDGAGNNSDPDIDNDGYQNQLPAKEVLQVECFAQKNESTCSAISGCGWTNQGRCAPVRSCAAGGSSVTAPDNTGRYPVSPAICNQDPGCSWDGAACEQLDYFPLDRFEHRDEDLDGLGDDQDPDDDNDGFPDIKDDYAFKKDAFFDFDLDGIYDWQLPLIVQEMSQIPANLYAFKIDHDSDNDGIPDVFDDFKWDPVEFYDIDNDLVGNNLDQDDDGDGVADVVDAMPYDPIESADTDNDGIGNNADPDDDNDGAPDMWDSLVFNRFGMSDLNNDGVPDEVATDIDGDLYSNGNLDCVGSVNNFVCSFPTSIDVFIWDEHEWYDEEPDGLGDNEDPDDDNDGTPDLWDDLKYNNVGFADFDKDNIPNEIDTDIDGDQVDNELDIFPYDDADWLDTDNDGLGDNSDPDSDNDGVSNDWDDFPLDPLYWADNDGDGISNELDVYTPNGVNNEAEMDVALANGEQLVFTSDITFTKCYTIPANSNIGSNDNAVTLKYNGPNNGCMFNVIGDSFSLNNIKFDISSANSVTVVRTNLSTGFTRFSIHQNEFKITGKHKILEAQNKELINITRNNIIIKTNVDIANSSYDNFITINNGTGLVTEDNTGVSFSGNILIWDITANQSNSIGFIKANNLTRSLLFNNNVVKLNKGTSTLVPPSYIVKADADLNQANLDKGILITDNRVNMNGAQLFNLSSSNNSLNNTSVIVTQSNKIFGLTTLGNPVIDFDYSDESANACISYNNETSCESATQCDWNGVSCIANGSLPSSFSDYYDFKEADIWLAPSRGDYSMFYLPNTTKLNNSPAIFASSSYDSQLEVYLVEEKDLGLGKVNYIGFYPPVLDDDMDSFSNTIDLFDFNSTEWFNNDNDALGNNADSDDDNDGVLDFAEKSYCSNEPSEFSCAPKTGCSWDKEARSCKRSSTINACIVSGSSWDSTSLCCKKDGICVDGTDPFVSDTDHDGLSDNDEMYSYNTNPLLLDTDGDSDTDSEEISNGTNPLDANSSKDSDGDGLNDNFERNNLIPLGCINPQGTVDTDGDGLNDYEEFMTLTTNACSSDSDADGLSDFEEARTYLTNPKISDTDNDGLSDGQEILTHGTNPKISDTDGDGAKDGQEIIDGTNPTSSSSFKDTDGDNESDYADKTPFGTVPCDNFSLGTCSNSYTATQLKDRFNLQLTEAYSCASKTSETSCNSNVFGLCKWNSATTTCSPKDIVVFNDLSLDDRCYTIPLAANNKTNIIKIRTANSSTRKNITLSNNLTVASGCNPGEGVFTLLANTGLILENLHFIAGNQLENIITNTSSTNRGGFSLETKQVSFHSERSNGSSFVKLRDYAKVSMEKTTIRQILKTNPSSNPLSSIDLTYSGTFCSDRTTQGNCELSSAICSWTGSSCIDKNITEFNLKGSIVSCETEDFLDNMFLANRSYSCVRTQSPKTDFDGNVITLDDRNGLDPADVSSGINNIYSWTHFQGAGFFNIRNSRIYSQSKTLNITNVSSNVVSTNLTTRNGISSEDIAWSGPQTPAPSLISGSTIYDFVFKNSNSPELYCNLGVSGDASTIHPMYFNPSPIRTFWHLINRTGPTDTVQIPGAVNSLCVP